jgi:hypothetical protein
MFKIVRQSARSLMMASRSQTGFLKPTRLTVPIVRFISPAATSIQEVSDRVFYVLSTFDKIDTEKLNLDARFDKVNKLTLLK